MRRRSARSSRRSGKRAPTRSDRPARGAQSELASRARRGCEELGLQALEVVVGDAGHSSAYSGAAPADLVLVCGVFGNISDEDVERTVRALSQLCAQGATVVWTRHRRVPDLTVDIRRWLEETGFESVAFETVPDPERQGSVGVARYASDPEPLIDQHLFTFLDCVISRRQAQL